MSGQKLNSYNHSGICAPKYFIATVCQVKGDDFMSRWIEFSGILIFRALDFSQLLLKLERAFQNAWWEFYKKISKLSANNAVECNNDPTSKPCTSGDCFII